MKNSIEKSVIKTSLISINHKFMSLSPKELVELIINTKYTRGIEAYININKEEELNYLSQLVFELKKNNLILQIHGEIDLELDEQIKYIKKLEDYSDYLNMPIVVTFHTIYDDNKEKSIEKTNKYISDLIGNINKEKITICIENLNNMNGLIRLGKEEISEIVLNNEEIYFTYDIGHEISDHGEIINLDKYMIEKIRNIHIHSINDTGLDHIPIYENDIHWDEIIKGLDFLINNKYKYNIVYEYGLEYCNGSTVEEKVKDYLCSIDYVSERYENLPSKN